MKRTFWGILGLFMVVFTSFACIRKPQGQYVLPERTVSKRKQVTDNTVGSVARLMIPDTVTLEGYGLVGGLAGTGSSQCPANVLAYLRRYAELEVADRNVDVLSLVKSNKTAVVQIEARLGRGAAEGDDFDVLVWALDGTDTTSLQGGWLYTAALTLPGTTGMSGEGVAKVEGPVYIDRISIPKPDFRKGLILGGGRLIQGPRTGLLFEQDDFHMISRVTKALNERFGPFTVKAMSQKAVELSIPPHYKKQQWRFYSMIEHVPLDRSDAIIEGRIRTLVKDLISSSHKIIAEMSLEAIGPPCVESLTPLLYSPDEQVRLCAARCLLNLGSDAGREALVQMALDTTAPCRKEAVTALATACRAADVVPVLERLLQDEDFHIVLSAYEHLIDVDSTAVQRSTIGRCFSLDIVPFGWTRAIVAIRRGSPRIVLFGESMQCQEDFFVQSTDGNITVDSRTGLHYILLARRHPVRDAVMGPLRSSCFLGDMIQVLCSEPVIKDGRLEGLGVSYDNLLDVIKQMCDIGFINAQFWAGPLPSEVQ